MNAKSLVPGIALSLVMATGCASLKEKFNDAVGYVRIEDVKAQLASSDKVQIETAEKEIYSIATRGTSSKGFVSYTEAEQLQFLDLTKNQELLYKIACDATWDDARMAAIKKLDSVPLLVKIIDRCYAYDSFVTAAAERIDFSKPGAGMEVLKGHALDNVSRVEQRSEKKEKISFKEKAIASLSEDDLRKLVENDDMDYDMKIELRERLFSTTRDVKLLLSYYDGELKVWLRGRDERNKLAARLTELAKDLPNETVVKELLNQTDDNSKLVVNTARARYNLLKRLSKEAAVEFVLNEIRHHSVYDWNKKEVIPLNDGVILMAINKDPDVTVKVAKAILGKFTDHFSDCRTNYNMSWGKEDWALEDEIIKRFPKFSEAVLERLICECIAADRFVDQVPEDMAYRILTSGRAPMDSTEVDLLKKLSPAKIDMAVYNGVKYDETKKELEKLMTPEMKQQIAEANAKKVEEILAKAKDAAKDTFEFNGFYLGMKWEDVKTLFVHYFHDFEFTETKGDDGLPELYVSYQRSPFCLANKDGVAVQFNFGKKILKKWIQYDVQNEHEWANKYAADNKIDMNFKMITKKATVYERDLSASYTVLFYQNSYQYRNNAKEYRLTYFGEEKDWTIEGGVGGALIKEMAAPKFKYTRGDQGSLRAGIERD